MVIVRSVSPGGLVAGTGHVNVGGFGSVGPEGCALAKAQPVMNAATRNPHARAPDRIAGIFAGSKEMRRAGIGMSGYMRGKAGDLSVP